MKFKLRGGQVHCGLLALITVSGTCLASDDGLGTINIMGEIHNNTCVVDTTELNVNMGNVATKQFYRAGNVPLPVHFTIGLKDCGPEVIGVAVKFVGQPAIAGSPLVKLDASVGAATGLGISLMDRNKTQIAVNDNSGVYPLISGNDTATLDFYAQYSAYTIPVTAGPASASVTFTMTYQ